MEKFCIMKLNKIVYQTMSNTRKSMNLLDNALHFKSHLLQACKDNELSEELTEKLKIRLVLNEMELRINNKGKFNFIDLEILFSRTINDIIMKGE